jgi:hypothetical protein
MPSDSSRTVTTPFQVPSKSSPTQQLSIIPQNPISTNSRSPPTINPLPKLSPKTISTSTCQLSLAFSKKRSTHFHHSVFGVDKTQKTKKKTKQIADLACLLAHITN